jgi:branched-chain amino acid transport system permease protein
MDIFLQLMMTGASLGMGYALGGLGFVLIYKSTGVFNFSHGQLMMVGGYFFYMFQVQIGLPVWWAFLFSVLSMYAVGMAIERIFLRSMIGEPTIAIIMLTVGLGSFLRNLVGLIWGTQPFAPEPLFKQGFFELAGVQFPSAYAWTILAAILGILGFLLYFQKSAQGVAMRAVAFDQDKAALSGISVSRVFARSWGLASVMACISGVLIMQMAGLDLSMDNRGLSAFPAAIVGGVDSVGGVILGGLVVGIAEMFAGGYIDPYIGGGAKQVVGFVIMLLILMVRPYGLFGTPEIRKV